MGRQGKQLITRRASWVLTALGTAVIGLTAATSAWGATAPNPTYPVPYNFLGEAIVTASSGPDTPPPGSDIWSCRPSQAHPNPVVLVHGLLANQTDNWQTLSPLLADNGYCVFSLTYGNTSSSAPPFDYFGGLAPMQQSAEVLSAFVNKVLAATGAAKVDIVGHSEGATMPYWYLKFDGGAAKVARMIGMSPVVHGTDLVGPPLVDDLVNELGLSPVEAAVISSECGSCLEFQPTSSFIQWLDANGITAPGVTYTQIVTRYDELVLPYTSGIIVAPNSTNFVLQKQCATDFSDHLEIASDPVAMQDVLNALDPPHSAPVPCLAVLPLIGP
jgi:triacylglycerol lipase